MNKKKWCDFAGGLNNNVYIYDAAGTKLAKIGTSSNYAYYAGSFVYSGSSLSYILTKEGMYLPGGNYQYYLKDHLGNTRVSFQRNGSTTTTTQVAEYYPFGSTYSPISPAGTNKYFYNGKETQDDVIYGTALDEYDYGARFYDPRIGRWHVIDPLAEKYFAISPYIYCHNNPINIIDPNGLTDYLVNKEGDIIKKNPIIDAVKKFIGIKDKNDKLIAVDNKNNTLELKAGTIGTIKDYKNDKGDVKGNYFNVTNDKDAGQVSEFLSENTGVEWSRTEFNYSKETDNIISTSHKPREEEVGSSIVNQLSYEGYNVTRYTHSHPEGGPPSGYVRGQLDTGDKDFVNYMNKNYPNNAIAYRVYDVPKRRYIYFNNKNIIGYEPKN